MAELELDGLTKRYGRVTALDRFSLRVGRGQFVSLLGPSGCGKTTALRIIAGFIRQTEGTIRVDGAVADAIPPHRRDIGMVFQNYALFPHMTVARNVEFGLNMRKTPKAEAAKRVAEALELVRLSGLEQRYPSQLSGGQQQRVAVARAIVINPTLLLLDEPLSNLDAKLRVETREEIRRLQRQLGVTTVFVTHDQEEALTISDRIAVMRAGRLEQEGTPEELYDRPRTPFVAGFIGSSNLYPGRVIERAGDTALVALDGSTLRVLDGGRRLGRARRRRGRRPRDDPAGAHPAARAGRGAGQPELLRRPHRDADLRRRDGAPPGPVRGRATASWWICRIRVMGAGARTSLSRLPGGRSIRS